MIGVIKQENINICLYYMPLPEGIHGVTQKSSGNLYKILLNTDDSPERNYISFLHEMTHIYRKDLEKEGCVSETERQTHDQLIKALEEMRND